MLHAAGKTLTVHAVARACAKEALHAASPPVLCFINCMTLQAPSHVFRRILDGLSASHPTACSVDSAVRPGRSDDCLALDVSSSGWDMPILTASPSFWLSPAVPVLKCILVACGG